MRRPIQLTLLVLGILVLLGGALVWSTLRRGFSAHDEPSRMEAWVARSARHWATAGTRVAIQLTEDDKAAVKVKIGTAAAR